MANSKSQREEFEDRWVDLSLRRLLGKESPPDLLDRILAATEDEDSAAPATAQFEVKREPKRKRLWVLGLLAAAALLVIGVLIFQPGGSKKKPSVAQGFDRLPDLGRPMDLRSRASDGRLKERMQREQRLKRQRGASSESSAEMGQSSNANSGVGGDSLGDDSLGGDSGVGNGSGGNGSSDVNGDGEAIVERNGKGKRKLLRQSSLGKSVPSDSSPGASSPRASSQYESALSELSASASALSEQGQVASRPQSIDSLLRGRSKGSQPVEPMMDGNPEATQGRDATIASDGSDAGDRQLDVEDSMGTSDLSLDSKSSALSEALEGEAGEGEAGEGDVAEESRLYGIAGESEGGMRPGEGREEEALSVADNGGDFFGGGGLGGGGGGLGSDKGGFGPQSSSGGGGRGSLHRHRGESLARRGESSGRRSGRGNEAWVDRGTGGDNYSAIVENPFKDTVGENARSTFSVDVDTASYANVRQFLMKSQRLPQPDAVRIEEMINYFDYGYEGPKDEHPFAVHVESADCPWSEDNKLVRIALKGRDPNKDKPRALSNLVFLIDVSGSMNQPDKLPLVVTGLKRLTEELGENDRVAIVVYASAEGLALPSTPGDKQDIIQNALSRLTAGGSTAGGAGINLAYQVARDNFIVGGVNRVLLCTDGDFNVGTTSTEELERLAEENAKTGVFLTALGFGRGNLNDEMMEKITNKGNGNYHYIDSEREAEKVLVEEMAGTLMTIAKDVKVQVEFNPAVVASHRLIGYENRVMAHRDFRDDKKDAGEIGAGHTVTALYEIVPADAAKKRAAKKASEVAPLKYQTLPEPVETVEEKPKSIVRNPDESLTVRLRYKKPDGNESKKLEYAIKKSETPFEKASDDFRFAASVASFGMVLRDSQHKGNATFDSVLETASAVVNEDSDKYRREYVELIKRARVLSGRR